MPHSVTIVDLSSGEVLDFPADTLTLDPPEAYESAPLLEWRAGAAGAQRVPLSSRRANETFLVDAVAPSGRMILSVVEPGSLRLV